MTKIGSGRISDRSSSSWQRWLSWPHSPHPPRRRGASRGRSTATPTKPLPAAAWRALIGKAQKEGSVNLYSVQAPANLAALAKAFKAKYGITVNVNRNVDNVMLAQINAEQSTGKAIADIWVPSPEAVRHRCRQQRLGRRRGRARTSSRRSSTARRYMVGKGWHRRLGRARDGLEHEGRPGRDHRRQELHRSGVPG